MLNMMQRWRCSPARKSLTLKKMNSGQLHNALSNAEETGHRFRGVYMRDDLPRNLRKGFYIVNFDKKGKPGSHWICIENGDKIVYFDSYG